MNPPVISTDVFYVLETDEIILSEKIILAIDLEAKTIKTNSNFVMLDVSLNIEENTLIYIGTL